MASWHFLLKILSYKYASVALVWLFGCQQYLILKDLRDFENLNILSPFRKLWFIKIRENHLQGKVEWTQVIWERDDDLKIQWGVDLSDSGITCLDFDKEERLKSLLLRDKLCQKDNLNDEMLMMYYMLDNNNSNNNNIIIKKF